MTIPILCIVVACLILLVIAVVFYHRKNMSKEPERRLSIGLTLTDILPPCAPVAEAIPYGSVAIEQTEEFTANEIEEEWSAGMRAIGKWCGVPNDLVAILERMQNAAQRSYLMLRRDQKKQKLFQLLVKKRKAYPKSWNDEVVYTVKELMSLMSQSVVISGDESMVNPMNSMNPNPIVANATNETKTQAHQRHRSVRLVKIKKKMKKKNKKEFGQNKMDSREHDDKR